MSDSTQSRSDFPLADIVVAAGSLLVQIPQDMLRAARDKARHDLGMYEATGMLFEPPYLLNAKIDLFRAEVEVVDLALKLREACIKRDEAASRIARVAHGGRP